MRTLLLPLVCLTVPWSAYAQRPLDDLALVREQLLQQGYHADDLAGLEVRDSYVTGHNGISHTFLRQRWQGIEVYNGDIAIHRTPNGDVLQLNNGAWAHLAKRVNATQPSVSAMDALGIVLSRTVPGIPPPSPLAQDGLTWTFDGSMLGGEPVTVHPVFQPVGDGLRLAWNVNHYTPDGSHWWNVRIDALTGEELDRNDWVSQCTFGHQERGVHVHDVATTPDEEPALPAAPNDMNVYPWPTESPSHGPRQIRNAPWLDGGIASPYGWHDTNGTNGAEYTITRGNNVWAKEDIAADNETTAGFGPNGGAGLDFDFAINLANAPSTNQSAVITNLFYWNNVIHDVWYGYGFDEPSGNFQQNNYGRGGTGNDYVLADALDGSGTNNANFATPGDGTRPRMQMYVWTATSPNRTSDLDNGIIAHEYAHGVSNRLVGGPSNVNCLGNAEQMGEGWSDFFSLIMTIKAGDVGTTGRGIGTYVLGQATTGPGIRPARYSTAFGVNGYTYGATNNASISQPHGIGFIWCTMLWELTWELIGVYGLDPDIYNGTGGNNLAMQLVIDGMKLTPCNPGFVDARNAILLADQINNGGANQASIWAAFARRGLGFSASQGSSANRSDQVEAFDLPLPNNVGIASVSAPQPGQMLNCANNPITVTAVVRNFGTQPQSNFPVRYQLDGGAFITQNFTGTLAPNSSAVLTFTQQVVISGLGAHTLSVSTNLSGDQYAGDNQVNVALSVIDATVLNAPLFEGLSTTSPTPTGWRIENPDNATTWSTTLLTNGTQCASSRAWSIDHYNYNGAGQEDRLITPLIDLTYMTASRLRFSHAYARYSASYFEGFRVNVSGNCGASWTTVFNASGTALATAADATAPWQPANCSQWYDHDINIGAFDGQQILVRFVTICGYGNFFYLDEVEVTGINSPLPVELVTLSATPERAGIRVDWATASEQNSERFDVQRSIDLEQWTTLGIVPAAGNSVNLVNYTLLDRAPVTGINYYRLHMLDRDGTSEHSGVVSAEWREHDHRIWPNPNTGMFTVTVEDPSSPMEVLNALGEVVPMHRLITGDGRVDVVLSDAAPGLYLVRIGSGDEARNIRVMVTAR